MASYARKKNMHKDEMDFNEKLKCHKCILKRH